MADSISNVPVLGGLKKIIEAPFKLVGNTFQTAGSVFTGDTERFKNGLGGAVNNVFDVPAGALEVVQDGINALRPRRQGIGYTQNRPQQYVGPTPQVAPQPVAPDPALQPPKEYLIPELDFKIEDTESVDDNVARAENANKTLNDTIARAGDADKKLNDTIKKAQEENARLEQNIAKAKDIPAAPVAPAPPKAEPPAQKEPEQVPPPVAKAPEKPEENKINWKKWLLIGGGIAAAVGLFFLLKGRGSKPAADLIKPVAGAADDATKLLTGGADDVTKLLTNGADDVIDAVVVPNADDATKILTNSADDIIDAVVVPNADDATKILTNNADDIIDAVVVPNADDATKLITTNADKVTGAVSTATTTTSTAVTSIDDFATKGWKIGKRGIIYSAGFKEKAIAQFQAGMSADEIFKSAGIDLSNKTSSYANSTIKRWLRASHKKVTTVTEESAKIIQEIVENKGKNLKDLNITINGQSIDAGKTVIVQGKVDPGLVLAPKAAPKAPKTRTFYEALSDSDKKVFDDFSKKLKTQEMDAMWDAKKAQELAEQAKIKAQTEKEIAEHFANPPKAPKAPKAPAATIPPVTNPVKKPVAVTPATLNQTPMGTLEELLPAEAKKLDAVVTSNPVVLTAKKGAQFRLGDKVKVRLSMNGVPKKDQKALQDSFRSLLGGKDAALWKNHTQVELDLTSSNLGQIKKLQKHLEIVAA